MTRLHGTRRRHVARVTAAAGLVALALVATFGPRAPAVAAAGDPTTLAVADLGAQIVVGYGRGVRPYDWSAVEVTLSPRVPIAGMLEFRTDGPMGASLHLEPVEVAAGATKAVHFVLPPGEDIQARFLTSDGSAVRIPGQQERSNAVLVGAIGAPPSLPDTLTSAGSDRTVRGVAVDPALLELAPRSLEALDALVLSAGDLASLEVAVRDAVAVAVAQGLDLIVPVTVGQGPFGLPWEPLTAAFPGGDGEVSLEPAAAAWALTAADLGIDGTDQVVAAATPAGRGRVVATAVAPGSAGVGSAAPLWAALLQPRADNGPPMVSVEHGGLSRELFGASVSVPGATGAAVFVLVFLLVVGPLNALVLRRLGRRELAWVTVPALAAAFTLLAVLGAAQRAPTTAPVVHASWWVDGVGEELTAVGVQGAGRGAVSVGFPGARDVIIAEPWSGLAGSVTRSDRGASVTVGLESLQATTALAWAPAGSAPLEVAASFEAGVAEVVVENVGEATLTRVELHLATHVERLDDLAPGDQRTIVLDQLPTSLPQTRWADGRGGGMFFDGRGRPAAPRPEAGIELLRGAVLDDTPGLVWVTATTTDDLAVTRPEVRGTVSHIGTTIAVGVTPSHRGELITPYQVHRHLLRGQEGGWRPGPLVLEGASEALIRFRVPAPASIRELASTLAVGGPFRDVDHFLDRDPWEGGCWDVTTVAADGTETGPEERCGDAVACPMGANSCGGDDRFVEACWDDGRCQRAVRTSDDRERPQPDIGTGELAGVEILDVTSGGFVPAAEAIEDDRADGERFVSPLGEVLLRVREAGRIDLARRGIGFGGTP